MYFINQNSCSYNRTTCTVPRYYNYYIYLRTAYMDLTNLNQVDTTAEHAIISFSVINTGGEQKHRKKKAPFCRIMILFGIISYTQCSRNAKNSAKIDLFINVICYFVVGCTWNHEMSFCEIGFSLKIFAPFCGFQSILSQQSSVRCGQNTFRNVSE